MWTYEKGTGDIVINGFEKGIAPSPFLGIANEQCVNITTEPGEASVTYARTRLDQPNIGVGTLIYISSNTVLYSGGTVPLLPGFWITITAGITGLAAGTYFVYAMTSGTSTNGNFQLSTSYSSSGLVTTMSGGSATFNSLSNLGKLVASTVDLQTETVPQYFMMDSTANVFWRNGDSSSIYWKQLQPNAPTSAQATGLQAFNGYLFRFYVNNLSVSVIDYASVSDIYNGTFTIWRNFVSPTGNTANLLTNFTHQTLSGHDNTLYYTDGTYVGSIAPAYSKSTGTYAVTTTGAAAIITAYFQTGVNLVAGENIVFQALSIPTGLNPGTTYYVGANVGISPTSFGGSQTFSVATTHANALAGIYITISTAGTGPLTFVAGAFQLYDTVASTPVIDSFTWNPAALQLPAYETAQCLAELGTNLMCGGATNNIYPWDRSSTTSTTATTSSFFYPLLLPENNTTQMVTVNNMLFIFCGYKGNVYITNGSSASLALTIPDYVTGEIEPYYQWGASMYLRGRIWFSVQAPNCGGVWSFVPTLNQIALGQDVGMQLKLENQNSNGTYNGYASVLLPQVSQLSNGPQYWSGTTDGIGDYSIDGSSTTPLNSPGLIESDAIPTGTFLTKKTFANIEYKLSAKLAAGESIALYYRIDLGFGSSGAWVSCGTLITESNGLSGYYSVDFESSQWLQIRAILTSTNTNPTFCRLKEIRIR